MIIHAYTCKECDSSVYDGDPQFENKEGDPICEGCHRNGEVEE